jgi:hypothetical protein
MKSKKILAILVAAMGLMVFSSIALAGNLEPDAAPGSTMKTLDEVEPRIPILASDTPVGTFTISESGSYYLTGNRQCSGTGIQVDVNDVTIDLCGYTLSGPDSTSSIYGINISGTQTNIHIRNGTIRDFKIAVNAGTGGGENQRVDNIRAISNTYGGINLNHSNCAVTGCTITDNGISGSGMVGIKTFANSIVTGNIIANNGTSAGYAVYGIDSYNGCVVTNNVVYNNGDSAGGDVYGIRAYEGCTLTGNTASDNGDSATGNYVYGIFAGHGSTLMNNAAYDNADANSIAEIYGIVTNSGCLLSGNTSYRNGRNAENKVYGIYAFRGCTLENNTAKENGNSADPEVEIYGIYVFEGCTVKGNTAHWNGYLSNSPDSYGIYTKTGCTVIGNTAYQNGYSGNGYGIFLGGNNFVDQNTAYGNYGTNMNAPGTGIVTANNHAP